MLACESDSSGADAVLSRRRLRSMDTMETVVVQFGVGSCPEAANLFLLKVLLLAVVIAV